MSLDYIRKAYGVPAKRGGRVRYFGEGRDEFGTIAGASGAHLSIRLDGIRHAMPFHPTWKLEYLTPAEEVAPQQSDVSGAETGAAQTPENPEVDGHGFDSCAAHH